MKTLNPLQFYVDKLKNGEKFSLARYGDGEFNCIWDVGKKNSNGCWYTRELKMALIRSFEGSKPEDPTFIYGMQRVLPKDEEKAYRVFPSNIKWHDTEIFSEAVANGELYPLIEQLRKMKVVVIGNQSIKDFVREQLHAFFIPVPPDNAYDFKEIVIENIETYELIKEDGPVVYLFSCGMAANAFISELHGVFDGWLIDLGHIWDPFTGNMSRCDLEGKTLEDINKNLHEKA